MLPKLAGSLTDALMMNLMILLLPDHFVGSELKHAMGV